MTMESPTLIVGSGHANEVMLKQLGEIAVDGSRLEHLAAEIARHLKLPAEPLTAVGTLCESTVVPPPWSTLTARDITAWSTSTGRLLEIRDRMFAASGGSRFAGSRGDTIATESVDGTVFPADEEYLARYLKRLERQLAAGAELESRLDYHDENGQRWPLVTIYAQHASGGVTGEPALKLPTEWQSWLSA